MFNIYQQIKGLMFNTPSFTISSVQKYMVDVMLKHNGGLIEVVKEHMCYDW